MGEWVDWWIYRKKERKKERKKGGQAVRKTDNANT
jgi:hypothetical protein